jgi:hypothetical protein
MHLENREVTLGAFLDIPGAVNSTSLDSITQAAKLHGLGFGDTICRLISSMLGGSHNRRRNSAGAGICAQGVSTGSHFIASVEPGCG